MPLGLDRTLKWGANKTHLFRAVSSSLLLSSHRFSQICSLLPILSTVLQIQGTVPRIELVPGLPPSSPEPTGLLLKHCNPFTATGKVLIKYRPHPISLYLKLVSDFPLLLNSYFRTPRSVPSLYFQLHCCCPRGPPHFSHTKLLSRARSRPCHLKFHECWVSAFPLPSQNTPGSPT